MIQIKIHNKHFQFDDNEFDNLVNHTSESTYILRWKLDEHDHPYYVNKNKKVIYLIDKIMNKDCKNNLHFVDGNKYNYQKHNIRLDVETEQEKTVLNYNSKQNKNTNKRKRKYNAIKLPDEIDESKIPKYIYYCKEMYNKEKELYREFFRIEKHPNLKKQKCLSSSKSQKISLQEKLEETIEMLKKLDNNENITSKENVFATGIRLKNNEEFILDYRNKEKNKRYNLKQKCKKKFK